MSTTINGNPALVSLTSAVPRSGSTQGASSTSGSQSTSSVFGPGWQLQSAGHGTRAVGCNFERRRQRIDQRYERSRQCHGLCKCQRLKLAAAGGAEFSLDAQAVPQCAIGHPDGRRREHGAEPGESGARQPPWSPSRRRRRLIAARKPPERWQRQQLEQLRRDEQPARDRHGFGHQLAEPGAEVECLSDGRSPRTSAGRGLIS